MGGADPPIGFLHHIEAGREISHLFLKVTYQYDVPRLSDKRECDPFAVL